MLDRLGQGKPLVADGAIGTLLMTKGLEAGMCPETFNLEKTEILEEVARLYMEAGAEIIHTNTFGGSSVKLSSHSLEGKFEEINKNAVMAVRKVVGEGAVVSASIGPTGKLLKPYGDVDPETVAESYEQQIEVLVGAGIDAVTIETMTDLEEARLAIKAAKSAASALPVMATMTFDPTPRGFFTIMGVSIEQAGRGLEEAGADVIGSNCGNGIERMVEIARALKSVSSLPLLIQANAGLPELRGGESVYPESAAFMAEKAKALVDLGVAVIGGCCGTTPEHIRALRQMVDSVRDSGN